MLKEWEDAPFEWVFIERDGSVVDIDGKEVELVPLTVEHDTE